MKKILYISFLIGLMVSSVFGQTIVENNNWQFNSNVVLKSNLEYIQTTDTVNKIIMVPWYDGNYGEFTWVSGNSRFIGYGPDGDALEIVYNVSQWDMRTVAASTVRYHTSGTSITNSWVYDSGSYNMPTSVLGKIYTTNTIQNIGNISHELNIISPYTPASNFSFIVGDGSYSIGLSSELTPTGIVYYWAYRGTGGVVSIPPMYNGLPVISANFNGLQLDMSHYPSAWISEIILPETITSISMFACTNLRSIVFPRSVLSSGDFSMCDKLSNIVFGTGIKHISQDSFYLCPSLTSVTIPSQVETIGAGAFVDCSGLTEVYFEGDLPEMGANVFANCPITNIYYKSYNKGFETSIEGFPTAVYRGKDFSVMMSNNILNNLISTNADISGYFSGFVGGKSGVLKQPGYDLSGQVITWGSSASGKSSVPEYASNSVVKVDGGVDHLVALRSDGRVVAWGSTTYNQTDVPVDASNSVVDISAGLYHTLALRSDGRVVAWGRDHLDQCKIPIEASNNVISIGAGLYSSMALRSDGRVIKWGETSYGQSDVPVDASNSVIAVADGSQYAVALRSDGRVVVWGRSSSESTIVPIDASNSIVAVSANLAHILALRSDGRVVAWGTNTGGQCNVPILASNNVISISAGAAHSMALRSDGRVVAWGTNTIGQCNVPILASNNVISINCAYDTSLAIIGKQTTPGLILTGDLNMKTNIAWQYWGSSDSDGSWRIGMPTTNLVVQVRVGGVWTNSIEYTRPSP